jgi:hypothetical protein
VRTEVLVPPVASVPGSEDVDVADCLLVPAQRSRIRAAAASGNRGQLADDLLGEVHRHVDVHPVPGELQELNAVQELFLGLGTESLEVAQPLCVDGVHQLLDRCDAQLLVEDHRLAWPEGRNGDQVADAGRDRRMQLVERLHMAGLEIASDLRSDRGADTCDLLQPLLA